MSSFTCLSIASGGSILIQQTNCSDTSATVGWIANPSGRGTASLVLSCVLTLGLCVWSAMHLNIPSATDTEQQIWWRNIRWTFMGVSGPELVMYVAWRQWSSSKALSSKVEECSFRSRGGVMTEKNGPHVPIYPWTLVHSFYASMGGFVFDIEPSAELPAFFLGPQRVTLTARGVALIAELGHLPNIPKDDITDKSKADGMAKAFVCLQACWVVIQVISRSVARLPITLLEVNTLGHVFCALIIYILWWSKPRLIRQPTVLRGEWVRPVCAYMYMSSQISGWHTARDKLLRMTWKDPEFNSMILVSGQSTISQSSDHHSKSAASASPSVSEIVNEGTGTSLETQQEMQDIAVVEIQRSENHSTQPSAFRDHFKPCPQTSDEQERGNTATGPPLQTAEEESMRTLRWQLAIEAIHRFPTLRARFFSPNPLHPSQNPHFKTSVEELVTDYSSNWPSPTLLKRSQTEGKKMGMALWCASMAYGAVHIAAWNYYFPSRAEAIMWRSSAVCITASGFIWLLINGLAHKSEFWNRYWGRFVKMRCSWYSYVLIGSLSAICGIAYGLSRLYLVIEAFVSIRQLPLAVYATPDWIQTIPHL